MLTSDSCDDFELVESDDDDDCDKILKLSDGSHTKICKNNPNGLPKSSSLPTDLKPLTSSSQSHISHAESDITNGPDITTDAAAKALIIKYLFKQNRPYSSIQIYDNLHKRIQKSCLERCFAVLCDSSLPHRLVCKEYGKSKIYFPDQSGFPSFSAEEFRLLEEDVVARESASKANVERERSLRLAIAALTAEPEDALLDG